LFAPIFKRKISKKSDKNHSEAFQLISAGQSAARAKGSTNGDRVGSPKSQHRRGFPNIRESEVCHLRNTGERRFNQSRCQNRFWAEWMEFVSNTCCIGFSELTRESILGLLPKANQADHVFNDVNHFHQFHLNQIQD
jgi:hypothetical protein